jgi:hypothetical protein
MDLYGRMDQNQRQQYPLFSLRGDFTMLWEVLTLQRSP